MGKKKKKRRGGRRGSESVKALHSAGESAVWVRSLLSPEECEEEDAEGEESEARKEPAPAKVYVLTKTGWIEAPEHSFSSRLYQGFLS